jgi:hypothetical protein
MAAAAVNRLDRATRHPSPEVDDLHPGRDACLPASAMHVCFRMKTAFEIISTESLSSIQGGASLQQVRNAATGFVGGLACLAKFTADGTPGTNSYDTYLACQRKAHQF